MNKKLNNTMKMKLFLVVLFSIMIISSASAVESSLGTFKEGNDIILRQLCSSCSYSNITSVVYDGNTILDITAMVNNDGEYTFNLTGENTTDRNGIWNVNGYGDVNGVKTSWVYTFLVTPTGEDYNIVKILVLITFIILILVCLLLCLSKIFTSENSTWFIIFSTLSYFLSLILVFTLWKACENYLYTLEWIVVLFDILFIINLIMMFPFIIFLIIYLLYNIFNEENINRMTEMGYSPEEAKKLSRR